MTTANWTTALTSTRLLLVEGLDEVNMVNRMLSDWNVSGIQVVDIGGKYRFKPSFEALLSQARSRSLELSAIGVLRDADDSPERAVQSVENSLQSLSLPAPHSHAGFTEGTPSVGIFIVPDGGSKGSVEDLCWASVESSPAAQCAASYLDCLQRSDALQSKNNAKTLVHAYLSAQDDPCARVGEGALKGYWSFDHPVFAALKEFVFRLAVI